MADQAEVNDGGVLPPRILHNLQGYLLILTLRLDMMLMLRLEVWGFVESEVYSFFDSIIDIVTTKFPFPS